MAEYIEREAVMQAFSDFVWNSNHSDLVPAPTWNHAVEIVRDIPAADVRPVVRGKWIPVTNGRGGHECSVCHDYAPSYQNGTEYLTKFCPNCGAKMDGGADK